MAIGRGMFVGVSAGHHCTMGYYWHQPSPCHSAGLLDKKLHEKTGAQRERCFLLGESPPEMWL